MVKYGIASLVHWLEKRGYEVNFGSKSSYIDPVNKEVAISHCGTQVQAMYTLAHEAGHLVLYKDKNYEIAYRSVQHAENVDARHAKSKLYRYKKIKEEIAAWDAGYELMIKLGVKVNRDAYDLYSAKWVGTYIKFLSNNTSPAA